MRFMYPQMYPMFSMNLAIRWDDAHVWSFLDKQNWSHLPVCGDYDIIMRDHPHFR